LMGNFKFEKMMRGFNRMDVCDVGWKVGAVWKLLTMVSSADLWYERG
jgi:hypothetical protein